MNQKESTPKPKSTCELVVTNRKNPLPPGRYRVRVDDIREVPGQPTLIMGHVH